MGPAVGVPVGVPMGVPVGLPVALAEGLDVGVFSTVPPCEENDMSLVDESERNNAIHAHWQLPFSPHFH